MKAVTISLQKKVFVRFKDVPLIDGIKKILNQTNHLVVIDQKGKINRIFLLHPGQYLPLAKYSDPKKGKSKTITEATIETKKNGPPIDPDTIYKELPKFTPTKNTTGPAIDPDKRKQGFFHFDK